MLFVALLLVSAPLLMCMPLTADPALYDLQAKTVLSGGVLYRDIVEPNLPGIVWLHLAIRGMFGWSEYALKGVDLAVVLGITFLLSRWFAGSRNQQWLTALFVFWFYAGTSEWCHCQRDTWLFLPALIALYLRWHQINRIEQQSCSANTLFAWGVLEGIVWACGFWIKPFIAFPALAAMAVGWQRGTKTKSHLQDLSGILVGGLLIGSAGISWLIASGTWAHFWEMAIEWNPTYFEVGRERWTWDRLFRQQLRYYPFSLAHLTAIPLACWFLWNNQRTDRPQFLQERMLSAVYLGWLFQTFYFQHLFDYIHVPELMLAITLTVYGCQKFLLQLEQVQSVSIEARFHATPCGFVLASLTILVCVFFSPATRISRVQHWADCLQQGSTPEIKTALQHFPLPHWVELEPALEFLRRQNLKDGELTVHNVYLVHAYAALQLKPSSRFVYLDVLTRVFREHQPEIVTSLDQSGHRYILSSLLENGMTLEDSREVDPQTPHALPPTFPEEHRGEFPYQHPVVFRSGQYVVHRVSGTAAPLNPEFSPLAMTDDR